MYTKLVAGLSKSSMVEVKVNWRCNVVHDWVEPVLQEAARALYDRLGFSQDLIRQLGCSPPLGASGPGAERPRNRTPRPRFWGHGGRGPEVHQQALPEGDEARVLGLHGVRPGPAQHQRMGSGGQGEVQDQVLQGPGCSRSRGGTRTRPHACSW